jgi:hypothetical protein
MWLGSSPSRTQIQVDRRVTPAALTEIRSNGGELPCRTTSSFKARCRPQNKSHFRFPRGRQRQPLPLDGAHRGHQVSPGLTLFLMSISGSPRSISPPDRGWENVISDGCCTTLGSLDSAADDPMIRWPLVARSCHVGNRPTQWSCCWRMSAPWPTRSLNFRDPRSSEAPSLRVSTGASSRLRLGHRELARTLNMTTHLLNQMRSD